MDISNQVKLLNKIRQDLKFKNYYLCKDKDKLKDIYNIQEYGGVAFRDNTFINPNLYNIESLLINIDKNDQGIINDIVDWIINFDQSRIILIFKLGKSNILNISNDNMIKIQSILECNLYDYYDTKKNDMFRKLFCKIIKNNNYEFVDKILNYYQFWFNNFDELYIAAKKNIAMLSIICSNDRGYFPSIKVIQNMVKTGYITNAIYLLSFDHYFKYFYCDIYRKNTVTEDVLYDLYYNTIVKYKSYRLFIVLYDRFRLPQTKLDKISEFILVNNQYKIANFILNVAKHDNLNKKDNNLFYYDDIIKLHELDKYKYIEILKVFNNSYLPIKNGGYKIYKFL